MAENLLQANIQKERSFDIYHQLQQLAPFVCLSHPVRKVMSHTLFSPVWFQFKMSFASVFWNITIILMSFKNCVSSDLRFEGTNLCYPSSFTHCIFPNKRCAVSFPTLMGPPFSARRLLLVSRNVLWWFLSQQNCSFHILSQYQWTSQRMHRSTGFIFPFLLQLASSSQCDTTVSPCPPSILGLALPYNLARLLQCHSQQCTWHLRQ